MITKFEDIYPKTKLDFTLRTFTFFSTQKNINIADNATKIRTALDFTAPFCQRLISNHSNENKFDAHYSWKPFIVDIRIPSEKWDIKDPKGLPICEVTITDRVRMDDTTTILFQKAVNLLDNLMYYAGVSPIHNGPWHRQDDNIILDIEGSLTPQTVHTYAVDCWLARFYLMSLLGITECYGIDPLNSKELKPVTDPFIPDKIKAEHRNQLGFEDIMLRLFRITFGDMSNPIFIHSEDGLPDYRVNYIYGKFYSERGIQDPVDILKDTDYITNLEDISLMAPTVNEGCTFTSY